jgi:hypothetical protein
MESLPAEILLRICECLDREQMPSVLAFACASKYCYFATTTLLFRTIKFSVLSRPQLVRDVQECYDMLQRAESFSHVRRLVVDGSAPKEDDRELDPHYQWHRPKISAEERGYDDENFDQPQEHVFVADKTPAQAVYETNDAWRPLANLVKQLPSLTDLSYGCPNQFPPCLLQILHQHQPQCRLRINTFNLRSLNAPVTDAYELMLARSPCLYSIMVRCESHNGYDSEGIQNFNYEATMRLVAGLATSLKEVHMYHAYAGWSIALQEALQTRWQPWKGFTLGKESHSFSPGSLRCLRHSGHGSISRQIIEKWRAHTNFSVLRTLKLESGIDENALDYLATNCTFPSLTKLALTLITRNFSRPPTNDYFDIAIRFLRSLPPLSTLKLVGELHRINLDSFLDHHGSGLRELWLSPLEGGDRLLQGDIAQIAGHCPLLEDLAITLHRSRGDATEVATYKTLGSLQKLQHLLLTLDASDFAVLSEDEDDNDDDLNAIGEGPDTPNDPSFDEFEQQYFKGPFGTYRYPRNGHIRDAFINSALDETLARAIFWTISSTKPDGSLPLERLRVRVTGGGHFGQSSMLSSIEDVIWHLGRSWLVERNPRDDCRHELILKELGQQERGRVEAGHRMLLSPDVEPIFRRIWPAKQKECGDWRDDWHSWPLSTFDT